MNETLSKYMIKAEIDKKSIVMWLLRQSENGSFQFFVDINILEDKKLEYLFEISRVRKEP